MNSQFGKNFRISLFGESHGPCVGALIEGIPAGLSLDADFIASEMARRRGGGELATPRREDDIPRILSGIHNDRASGAPLAVTIENADTDGKAYKALADLARPGHADLTAYKKYGGYMDMTGGGPFSARFTAAYVFCGAVAKLILKARGVEINATLEHAEKLKADVAAAKLDGDSVGGTISCTVTGLPVGVGEPHFRGLENVIATTVFAVPAVKGIEFGLGFDYAKMRGSEANKNTGGILGGISNGEPLTFRVAMKPTPSIAKEQSALNLKTGAVESISVTGRHDPCVAIRAVSVIEAATAVAIADLMVYN